ncbi:MAG: DUF4440 domain-containing protein [Pyrinomonadaceae bacterium]
MKQLTRILLIVVMTASSSLLALGQDQGQNAKIAEAVIAMTKAEWAAGIRDPSSVAEQSKDLSEDYTEFGPEYPTRLEGKDMYTRINTAGATGSSRTISSEMFKPKVQVYNEDVAILSYQYVGMDKDKDGKTETTRVKVTRVYVKRDGKWMLVHKNVGADPLPK